MKDMGRVNHIPFYIFLVLLLLSLGGSYYRFVIAGDYMVGYEADCDQYTETCFIGCEDDACTEEYYYSLIKKYAPNVYAQCGPDITDCQAAQACLSEDAGLCEITYCNPAVDGEDTCETLTEKDFEEETATEGGVDETEETAHNNFTEI